ncbi:MAG: tetratricopeptide repeat protein [Bacteroidales bacterium]|nr:tetratricopeptide repeat protein [Bacteroidales bacterium]
MTMAQGERKYIRQGNKEYNGGEFNESEIQYRKALDKEINSYEGNFNLGDALYKQEKYEDAARKFSNIADPEINREELSRIYHNMGNSLLKNNQLQESIEAYKQALRNNPNDPDTKHNLAYAMNMLQQQQQQQQQNQDNQDQNQDQQEQEQEQEQQEQQEEQGEQEEQKEQPMDQISEEDARRMLEALQQDEQQLQEKLKKQKAKVQRIAVLKDW